MNFFLLEVSKKIYERKNRTLQKVSELGLISRETMRETALFHTLWQRPSRGKIPRLLPMRCVLPLGRRPQVCVDDGVGWVGEYLGVWIGDGLV